MDFLDRAISSQISKRSGVTGTSKLDTGGFFGFMGWGSDTKQEPVTVKKALTVSAVWNAVDIISGAVGVVPFNVYRKIAAGRERVDDHPVDWLLNQDPDGPEGYLTSFIFKKMTMTSLLLRGNCLYEIITMNNGDQKLNYIPWDDVTDIRWFVKDNGEKTLTYYFKNRDKLFANEVLHFVGMTFDGICGLSVIKYAALNMGIAIQVQQYSYATADGKGVRQGVISSANRVDAPAKTAIINGVKNALSEKSTDRFLMLDEGMTYTPISITPDEAQLIEQGRFTVEDMARWLNIAPHKIKSLQQSTNNNIEQQTLDFASDTIQPWVTSLEQTFAKRLLTQKERKATYYIKGNMNVILRSDMKARAEFYSKVVQGGIMTPDEVRALEELNAMPGGDKLRFPVNTQTQEEIDKKLNAE